MRHHSVVVRVILSEDIWREGLYGAKGNSWKVNDREQVLREVGWGHEGPVVSMLKTLDYCPDVQQVTRISREVSLPQRFGKEKDDLSFHICEIKRSVLGMD